MRRKQTNTILIALVALVMAAVPSAARAQSVAWSDLLGVTGVSAPQVVVDGQGNSYSAAAAHDAGALDDIVVAKHDAAGNRIWSARFNGTGNSSDAPFDLALDPQGNVIVAGSSWRDVNSDYDYVILKYSPSGVLLWTRYYDGGYSDDLSAVAVDAAGNIYATGASYIRGIPGADVATVKWDAAGNQAWVRRWDGGLGDNGVDVQVDAAGNAYVAATTTVNKGGSTEDIVTLKYDTSGKQLWTARFDSNAGQDQDEAVRLELDNLGDVYVLGHYWVDVRPDGVLLKYRADNGASVWTRRWSRSPEDDLPLGLSVDAQGNAFVTGQTYYGASDLNVDAYTSKFDANGNEVWSRVFNGSGGTGFDGDDRVVADGAGGVYLAGDTEGSAGYDIFAIHYLADGTQSWVQTFDNAGHTDDFLDDWRTMCPACNGIALDPAGNLILAGQSVRSGFGWDLTTLKVLTGGTAAPPPSSAQLSSLAVAPASVVGGATAQGTVVLTAPAPAAGAAVTLSSSSGVVSVPTTVNVSAGATSATFAASTAATTTATAVTITAGYLGATRAATLTVNPAATSPPPATDSVSVTKAEYTASQQQLRIEATSTSSTATLTAYVTSTGALVGPLANAGGGTYKAQFTWPANPVNVTVKSSFGGSASLAVVSK